MDIPCSMGCHEPDKNGYCIWCNRKVAEGFLIKNLLVNSGTEDTQ
jgi:predicted Fe-S protein YdhL (DUF1289 family)